MEAVGFRINPRSYTRGRRRRLRSDPVFDGKTEVTRGRIEDPGDFCREMTGICGAEVYRKSTEGSALGKSAAKNSGD